MRSYAYQAPSHLPAAWLESDEISLTEKLSNPFVEEPSQVEANGYSSQSFPVLSSSANSRLQVLLVFDLFLSYSSWWRLVYIRVNVLSPASPGIYFPFISGFVCSGFSIANFQCCPASSNIEKSG